MNFPRDPGTLAVIKEIEINLGLAHKNINGMSHWQLVEYINQLSLLLLKSSKLDS